MAKTKAPSILDIFFSINKGNLQPIYYFFGEDYYLLQTTVKAVEAAAAHFIASEFDKETFFGDSNNLGEVLDFASSFPFGSEKKLIIVKQFEKIKDKNLLTRYAESPVEFTILVLVHDGLISNLNSEPYKTLSKNNFIFEAKELRGKNLIKWLVNFVIEKGKSISEENASLLVDISGDNRSMLENQLEKIFTFMNKENEITFNHIRELTTRLKKYSIFDLQNAIGKKDKGKAISIAFNLLDNGVEPVFIIAMLTRYFMGVARIGELTKMNMPIPQAARIVGTHQFYYKDYQSARKIYSDKDIANSFRALLKADLLIKTTSANNKNIITILISEMLA